jgi:GAF domain-containing protein
MAGPAARTLTPSPDATDGATSATRREAGVTGFGQRGRCLYSYVSHFFCQHAVEARSPLVISDAREHPLLRDNLAIDDLGVVAYAGAPIITPEGHALGTLCVIDHVPRNWTHDQIDMLTDLAAAVVTAIELRAATRE